MKVSFLFSSHSYSTIQLLRCNYKLLVSINFSIKKSRIMKGLKITNRWIVVAGAILIQLALGAIYAWSVFTKLLTDTGGDYGFTATQTAWVFSLGLATFAVVMVFAGKWQAKSGPTIVALTGGLVLGASQVSRCSG
jgi:MFS family permease